MDEGQARFQRAIDLFDAANATDPNMELGQPKELLYAQRMSAMLDRFAPQANETVRLAVRAQHIERWKIPRGDYPMDRQGYHHWRIRLYQFHADRAGELMRRAGYDDDSIEAAKRVVGKRGLKVNPDTQLLEDVASMVFIEHYLLAFAESKPDYTEEQWLTILRKTWRKMSVAAQRFVSNQGIQCPPSLLPLIERAVSE